MKRVFIPSDVYKGFCKLGLRNLYHRIYNDDKGVEYIKLYCHRVYLDDIERKGFNQCVNNLIMAR